MLQRIATVLALVSCAHLVTAPSPAQEEVPVKATAGADAKVLLGQEWENLKSEGFPALYRTKSGEYESRMAYAVIEETGAVRIAFGGPTMANSRVDVLRSMQDQINQLQLKVDVIGRLAKITKELARLPGADPGLLGKIEEIEQSLAPKSPTIKK